MSVVYLLALFIGILVGMKDRTDMDDIMRTGGAVFVGTTITGLVTFLVSLDVLSAHGLTVFGDLGMMGLVFGAVVLGLLSTVFFLVGSWLAKAFMGK